MSVKKQIADLFGTYITITRHNWLHLFEITKSYETVYNVKNIRLITITPSPLAGDSATIKDLVFVNTIVIPHCLVIHVAIGFYQIILINAVLIRLLYKIWKK